jgi:Tfp pilus assembly protein FimT
MCVTGLMKILAAAAVLLGLYLSSRYSYLLFHTTAELISIALAGAIFVLAWNFQHFYKNSFLTFIGTAYLSCSFIDLLHTLSYKGMGVFAGYDANLPAQLWIAARYLQSFSLLAAPLFRNFAAGRRYDDAAVQVLAAAEYARNQAIADGRMYRLVIDREANTYRILAQEQGAFVELGKDIGNPPEFSKDIRLSMTRGDGGAVDYIDFYPSGRADPAIIEVLVINRNKAWANWIKERLASPGSVFVAVGAVHLAGNADGVRMVLSQFIQALLNT